MKQLPITLGCILAIALAQTSMNCWAANPPAKAPAAKEAAPAKPKELSPAELKRIRNENYYKGGRLLGKLRDATCRQKRQGSSAILPLVEEYLSMLKTPVDQGRPANFTPSFMHRKVAETISNPLNLRLLPEIKKHLDEAVRLAETPAEKAEADYARARILLQSSLDDEPEKHKKTMMDAFQNKEIPWEHRLDMMRYAIEDGILPDLDFEKVAWNSIKDEPKAHFGYYRYALRIQNVRGRSVANKLRRECTPEQFVEICDRAIADPDFRNKTEFIEAKANALVDMRQWDQAEKMLMGYCSSTNMNVRYDNCMTLGAFYVKTAQRYYGKPNQARMGKAIDAYSKASKANPRSSRPLYKIAESAHAIGDNDLSIRTYESIIPLEGGKTNVNVAIGLGNAFYDKDDWEKAIRFYGLYPDRLPAIPALNFCRSLFIEKRYEETLKWLKRYEKVARGRDAKREARYFQSEVEKLIPKKEE